VEQAQEIARVLRENRIEESHAAADLSQRPLQAAETSLRRSFDARWGGFSPAPKFPPSVNLRLLLRRWYRTGDENLLAMVRTTLDRMAAGGIYDQVGGGFHRYSVDGEWLVPHFEKMLYDNALLGLAYLEAWQVTADPEYARITRETVEYVLRDMTDAQGGFYSSEDADSEGEEGLFYLWRPDEVEAALGRETAQRFAAVYDVSEAGNFEGRNILHRSQTLEQAARMLALDPARLASELAEAREKLRAARSRRARPGRDDKVLVAWNGLMIDTLAQAGAALGRTEYVEAAARAADFLLTYVRADGRLQHYWRQGLASVDAYLDDYVRRTLDRGRRAVDRPDAPPLRRSRTWRVLFCRGGGTPARAAERRARRFGAEFQRAGHHGLAAPGAAVRAGRFPGNRSTGSRSSRRAAGAGAGGLRPDVAGPGHAFQPAGGNRDPGFGRPAIDV
jgi:uncharacterized protein YyaL (SSP411 family)